MTNNMRRVNLTSKHKRRWLAAVLPSEDLKCVLIIRSMMENEILCLVMTNGAGEVGTEAFRDVWGIC